jgi:hypothetical protein
MSESTLWAWLREKAKEADFVRITRIENALSAGTPDVNFCNPRGVEGWVELKYASRFPPSKKPTFSLSSQHKLTVEQEEFLLKCSHVSGILAQIGRERFFISNQYASRFNSLTEDEFRALNSLEEFLHGKEINPRRSAKTTPSFWDNGSRDTRAQ